MRLMSVHTTLPAFSFQGYKSAVPKYSSEHILFVMLQTCLFLVCLLVVVKAGVFPPAFHTVLTVVESLATASSYFSSSSKSPFDCLGSLQLNPLEHDSLLISFPYLVGFFVLQLFLLASFFDCLLMSEWLSPSTSIPPSFAVLLSLEAVMP